MSVKLSVKLSVLSFDVGICIFASVMMCSLLKTKRMQQVRVTLQQQVIGLVNLKDPNKLCQHGLGQRSCCPLCHSHAYMVKRMKSAVRHGVERLDVKHKSRDEDYLQHLEVLDWHEACLHMTE